MRRHVLAALTLSLLPLAACGGADKTETKVEMKDMEVVDGTTSDAMTDLDGVQSEGTAIALSGNAAANASTAAQPTTEAAGEDAEVLSDQ
ncbi:MAG: hypothetical protein OSA39_04970 [Sphingobium sp.]|nr:hypothetical protein [Sphingobium sp.]